MAGNLKEINGTRKAAIVLLALGEECASKVLSHLGPRDVQKVGYEMTQLKQISKDEAAEVLSAFSDTLDEQIGLGVSTDDYVRKVIEKALGKEKASNVMDRILHDNNIKGLENFKWMDARSIAEIIRLEHPQIIAIIMTFLEYEHAADVLVYFPEHLRADVLLRIATLDSIQPDALQELNDIMEHQFSGKSRLKMSSVGGVKTAAKILNKMDVNLETEILDNIIDMDSSTGQSIQDVMFVFDNLLELSDRDIQTILREVSSSSLILALKNAKDSVRQKIYKNMSKRAAQMLQDDLETKGPVRVSDVEQAQKEILTTVRRLSDAGDISMRAKGADEYV